MADLAHVIPLTGRRGFARMLVAAAAGSLVAGLAGIAIEGRDAGWAAGLLSLVVPGLGQLVQGAPVSGALLVLVTLGLLFEQFVLSGFVLKLGIVSFAALGPAAALHAATHGAWWSLPAGAIGGLAAAAIIERFVLLARSRRLALVEAAEHARSPEERTALAAEPVEHGAVRPLDRYTEAFLRYLLRFGHSRPDDWSVFDDPNHLDSALRYQLVIAGWSLYVSQNLLTPAYREAAATALGNFAERGRDYRVWSYTFRQNLRSFRIDGDPFGFENVMYSGYIADVVSMYEAMSGDRRYDAPGGYSVTDGSRTYEWSHAGIIANLARQHALSPFGAISCLPGWIWPGCQTFSLRAIRLGDLVHRENHSYAPRRYIESFERYFVEKSGKIDTCRSITGFAHPTYDYMIGVTGQAGTAVMMSAFGRGFVARHYERCVKPLMKRNADGAIELTLKKMDTYDTTFGWNPGFPYSLVMLYASEVGDTEAVAGLRPTLEAMLTPDDRRPGPGSIVSMAFMFLALANAELGLAAAHAHVPAYDPTPELESAPYPKLIVTSATTDGTNVRATIAPGPQANGPVELRFARLVPGARYRLNGALAPVELVAGTDGRVRASVASDRRQELVLSRVG